MGDILRASNESFTLIDASQGKDWHLPPEPVQLFGASKLVPEASQAVHFVKEIDRRAISQVHDRVGAVSPPPSGGRDSARAGTFVEEDRSRDRCPRW